MARNVGHVRFSAEWLETQMKLPKDHHIERVFEDANIAREFTARVVGPKMPLCLEGSAIETVHLWSFMRDSEAAIMRGGT
jgi:hypothetical protein